MIETKENRGESVDIAHKIAIFFIVPVKLLNVKKKKKCLDYIILHYVLYTHSDQTDRRLFKILTLM